MTHPSQLQLMMYAESALHPQDDAAQTTALSSHFTSCHECRSLVATLEAEARSFSKVLALSAKAQFLQAPNPSCFRRAHPLRDLALATLITSLVTGLVQRS